MKITDNHSTNHTLSHKVVVIVFYTVFELHLKLKFEVIYKTHFNLIFSPKYMGPQFEWVVKYQNTSFFPF